MAERISRLAQRGGVSLNQAVLRLLRHFIGSWTRAQADEMDRALKDFE